MAELTYATIQDTLRRLAAGETTIEAEGQRHTMHELAVGLRMTRGMLQAIAMAWSDAQVAFQPTAALASQGTGDDAADASATQAAQAAPGAAAAGQGAAGGEGDHWSASEIITHLLSTQNWYLMNMTRMVGRREHYDVMPRGLGDNARPNVPASMLAAELRNGTNRLLNEIDALATTANLETTRDSIFFGELSQRGWVMLAIIHDTQHFEQIQRLAQSPGFPRE